MKNILITGSTDGIGKLAAFVLAQQGHRVYVHGRNPDKVAQVVAAVQAVSTVDGVQGFVADFSSLEAVLTMADEVKKHVKQLDVLINNAGVYLSEETFTSSGLDMRFVVNYLAPFVLTEKLLPLLRNSSTPLILNLSSAAQKTVSLDALTGVELLSSSDAYAQSKLALTMWSMHLSRVEPTIPVVAVNPGSLLNTNMVREAFGKHWDSADKGAEILAELVEMNSLSPTTGLYFDNDAGSFSKAHSDAYDSSKIRRLLEATELLLSRVL